MVELPVHRIYQLATYVVQQKKCQLHIYIEYI